MGLGRKIKLILFLSKLEKEWNKLQNERSKGMKNWKTTLFGMLAMIAQGTKQLVPSEWHQLLDAISQVILAIGLVVAKDATNKQ